MNKFSVFVTAIFLFGLVFSSYGQYAIETKQNFRKKQVSIIERITKKKKSPFAPNVNLIFRSAANLNPNQSAEALYFDIEFLRIDVTGNISKNIYYHYRQLLNRPSDGESSLDDLGTSVQIAAVGARFGKFDILTGRQFAAFGGYEIDYLASEIYQFAELIQNTPAAYTGVKFAYNFSPSQQLQLQITDYYVTNFADAFGNVTKNIVRAKAPLLYTLNWNASFFDKYYNLRWSASLGNAAKKQFNYFYAFGNEFRFTRNFNMYFDFYYATDALDNKNIMSQFSKAVTGFNAQDTRYISAVTRANIKLSPNFRLVLKGSYGTSGFRNSNSPTSSKLSAGRYSSAFGYVGILEYYPFKDSSLRFYTGYTGRTTWYTRKASALGFKDFTTNQITLGINYLIPIW